MDLEKLASLPSSEERRKMLESFVGTQASEPMTTLLEKKLIMKNQQDALISFVKDATGMRETVKKDLYSRIERLGEVLTPADEEKFYQNLVSEKLGTTTTFEQAKVISDLAKKFQDAKANPDSGLEYGATEVALNNYMNYLRLNNEKVSFKDTLGNLKKNPLGEGVNQVSKIAGTAKGIKASLDDSAVFRQGWKTIFTNTQEWANNAVKSFSDIAKQLKVPPGDNSVLDGIKAEILSRPNSRAGLYKSMGLDVGNLEEAFPTTLPEKIPLFGRLYKASETAYTGFLYKMRADIADKLIETAQKQGVDMSIPLQQKSLGTLINSLTGRGNLGPFEKVGKEINTIFFSPKMVKSSFDFLTLHAGDKMSAFTRKQAAINLAKVVVSTAGIMALANTLMPGSAELDPRSSDFGKIKVGNTRFDISGGMASMVTLAARTLPSFVGQKTYTKSSTTGKLTEINSGKFGSQTTMGVFGNYFQNKLSPVFSVMKDLANQKDFNGNKISLLPTKDNQYQGEVMNLLAPLPITNSMEVLNSPNGADPLLTIIADAMGIATNTYGQPKKKLK